MVRRCNSPHGLGALFQLLASNLLIRSPGRPKDYRQDLKDPESWISPQEIESSLLTSPHTPNRHPHMPSKQVDNLIMCGSQSIQSVVDLNRTIATTTTKKMPRGMLLA